MAASPVSIAGSLLDLLFTGGFGHSYPIAQEVKMARKANFRAFRRKQPLLTTRWKQWDEAYRKSEYRKRSSGQRLAHTRRSLADKAHKRAASLSPKASEGRSRLTVQTIVVIRYSFARFARASFCRCRVFRRPWFYSFFLLLVRAEQRRR